MNEKENEREKGVDEERIMIDLEDVEVDVMRLLEELEAEMSSENK